MNNISLARVYNLRLEPVCPDYSVIINPTDENTVHPWYQFPSYLRMTPLQIGS